MIFQLICIDFKSCNSPAPLLRLSERLSSSTGFSARFLSSISGLFSVPNFTT